MLMLIIFSAQLQEKNKLKHYLDRMITADNLVQISLQ